MDAALIWKDFGGDIDLDGPDLLHDRGLYTAIILSLFTDRRAGDDDELPPGSTDRRGWWADSFPAVEGDKIGSRLWLLAREKILPATVDRARQYAYEALEWLMEDNIVSHLEVTARAVDDRLVMDINLVPIGDWKIENMAPVSETYSGLDVGLVIRIANDLDQLIDVQLPELEGP